MKCRQCGKEFTPNKPTQKFCSQKCCLQNGRDRKKTGEPPPAGEAFVFVCKHCGKKIFNDGRSEKHWVFCSKRCYNRDKEQRKEARKRYRGNNRGLSGGMSLSSLIRREKRSLD